MSLNKQMKKSLNMTYWQSDNSKIWLLSWHCYELILVKSLKIDGSQFLHLQYVGNKSDNSEILPRYKIQRFISVLYEQCWTIFALLHKSLGHGKGRHQMGYKEIEYLGWICTVYSGNIK